MASRRSFNTHEVLEMLSDNEDEYMNPGSDEEYDDEFTSEEEDDQM